MLQASQMAQAQDDAIYDKTWYDMYEAAAKLAETGVALVEHSSSLPKDTKTFTHAQLLQLVERLAVSLASHGVASQGVLGLHMERGINFAALILTCSRLGAYAMPMPLEYPADRLLSVASAAKTTVVVWEEAAPPPQLVQAVKCMKFDALDGKGASPPKITSPWEGGLVLSSSGSTGTPKLIARPQASFYHRLAYTWRTHPFAAGEHCLQKSHLTTTHSLYEMLEPLCKGVPLHILPDVGKVGVSGFWQLATAIQAQRLLLVPSLLSATITHFDKDAFPPGLKVITLMGEPPQRQACEQVLATLPGLKLYSMYGSTEASSSMVVDLVAECNGVTAARRSSALPLGFPISPHIKLHVLDGEKPVLEGTLHFSGPHLFAGYLGLAELTAEKLFYSPLVEEGGPGPDPDTPGLLYNTNDLVEFREGRWEHKGRTDDVVKVRGYRVQLGEVDHYLCQVPGVTTSVTLHFSFDGDDELLSFVTPGSIDVDAAREQIGKSLAGYMVPRKIWALDALPMTAQGKPNRQALKMLVASIKTEARSQQKKLVTSQTSSGNLDHVHKTASSGTTAQKIIALLYGVTGVAAQGDDHLAAAGLDSLNMMKLLAGMRQEFPKANVSDLMLLANPTVEELSATIDASLGAGGTPQTMNMDAVFGLRALFSLWIVRGHLAIFGCNQDIEWYDTQNYWRVNLYILLAGSTTAMLHDKTRESWWVMMKKFVPPLLPMYYIGWIIELPLNLAMAACEDANMPLLGFLVTAVLQQGNIPVAFVPLNPLPMGVAWYLSAQMFFYGAYNWMQDIMERKAVLCVPPWLCGCWDDEGCCPCPGCAPSRKGAPIKNMWELLLRLTQTWLIMLPVFMSQKPILHTFGPTRLPQFYMGMLVGQACLYVELDEADGKKLGWITDIMVFLGAAFSFGGPDTPWLMYYGGDVALAFLVFALCRAPNSWSARFLASSGLSVLAPYSYGIYLLHIPIMLWGVFAMGQGVQSLEAVVEYNYADTCWVPNDADGDAVYPRPEGGNLEDAQTWSEFSMSEEMFCYMPGFAYISIFCVTIVLSMLLTHLVHEPFQKFYNRRFLSKKSPLTDTQEQAGPSVQSDAKAPPQLVGAAVQVQQDDDAPLKKKSSKISLTPDGQTGPNARPSVLERNPSVRIDTAH